MKKRLSRQAFVKNVKDAVKQYDMFRPGERVLVAVSGGCDSVCLLRVLYGMRKSLGTELVVANMDHGIRGSESARDSLFVEKLAEELGLPFCFQKIDPSGSGRSKISVEEYLRKRRYEFFRKAASEHGCDVLATGHTIDDQAETVLLRLVTGSSLNGLAGIPAVRYEGDLRVVRPLIRTGKKEVLDHLDSCGWGFREDRTNKETKYLRNRIRHEVLPFLEKYNPRIRRSLANLSETIREDLDLIESEKEKAMGRSLVHGSPRVKIKDLVLQPKSLRKAVFKELFSRAGGDIKKLTYRHWKDMDCLICAGKKGDSLDLPGRVMASRSRDEIEFAKRI